MRNIKIIKVKKGFSNRYKSLSFQNQAFLPGILKKYYFNQYNFLGYLNLVHRQNPILDQQEDFNYNLNCQLNIINENKKLENNIIKHTEDKKFFNIEKNKNNFINNVSINFANENKLSKVFHFKKNEITNDVAFNNIVTINKIKDFLVNNITSNVSIRGNNLTSIRNNLNRNNLVRNASNYDFQYLSKFINNINTSDKIRNSIINTSENDISIIRNIFNHEFKYSNKFRNLYYANVINNLSYKNQAGNFHNENRKNLNHNNLNYKNENHNNRDYENVNYKNENYKNENYRNISYEYEKAVYESKKNIVKINRLNKSLFLDNIEKKVSLNNIKIEGLKQIFNLNYLNHDVSLSDNITLNKNINLCRRFNQQNIENNETQQNYNNLDRNYDEYNRYLEAEKNIINQYKGNSINKEKYIKNLKLLENNIIKHTEDKKFFNIEKNKNNFTNNVSMSFTDENKFSTAFHLKRNKIVNDVAFNNIVNRNIFKHEFKYSNKFRNLDYENVVNNLSYKNQGQNFDDQNFYNEKYNNINHNNINHKNLNYKNKNYNNANYKNLNRNNENYNNENYRNESYRNISYEYEKSIYESKKNIVKINRLNKSLFLDNIEKKVSLNNIKIEGLKQIFNLNYLNHDVSLSDNITLNKNINLCRRFNQQNIENNETQQNYNNLDRNYDEYNRYLEAEKNIINQYKGNSINKEKYIKNLKLLENNIIKHTEDKKFFNIEKNKNNFINNVSMSFTDENKFSTAFHLKRNKIVNDVAFNNIVKRNIFKHEFKYSNKFRNLDYKNVINNLNYKNEVRNFDNENFYDENYNNVNYKNLNYKNKNYNNANYKNLNCNNKNYKNENYRNISYEYEKSIYESKKNIVKINTLNKSLFLDNIEKKVSLSNSKIEGLKQIVNLENSKLGNNEIHHKFKNTSYEGYRSNDYLESNSLILKVKNNESKNKQQIINKITEEQVKLKKIIDKELEEIKIKTTQQTNITQISEQVYKKIENKFKLERQRRGMI